MSELYVAACIWGRAVRAAKRHYSYTIDPQTILTTQGELDRLRKLVEAKDEALRALANKDNWAVSDDGFTWTITHADAHEVAQVALELK